MPGTSEATIRQARRANAGSYTPTDDEREGLQAIESRWRPEEPLRLAYESQWAINWSFLVGSQHVRWDRATRQIVYQQTPSLRYKAWLTRNFCRPYVENEVAMSGAFNPGFRVRPKNSDPENFNKAEANQEIVTHYWDKTKMRLKRYDLLYLVKTFGIGWMKLSWDRTAGAVSHSDPQVVMVRGQAVNVVQAEYEGDIVSSIESPETVYYDLQARDIEDMRWIIHARARPIEWLEQNYPRMSSHVPLGIEQEVIRRQRWFTAMSSPGIAGGQPVESRKDWVLVRELFEMPSLDFPNGRYVIDANGVVLEPPKDNPNPGGSLGFIPVRDMLVPGRISGQCNLDNLIDMQRSYNRKVSKKEEHIVLTANAKVLFHAMADIPQSAMSTEIGEVIPWHGQVAPAYLIPPSMPPETDTELQRDRQDMDFITRSFGPGRGQYPGKVSGKMVSHLIEQEDRNKTPMTERLAENFGEWGTLVLKLAQKYVAEPRLIHVLGRGKQWSAKDFTGQDIDGNCECSVDVESMFPKSRTMAMELITPLTQLGWLSPMNKQDRAKVFKSLAMEDDAPITEDATLDLRRARNENRFLMEGQMVEPAQYWEDQDIHMLIHAECAKSDEYKAAPGPIQDMLKAHMQSHIALAMPKVGLSVPPPEPDQPMAGEQIDAGPPPQRSGSAPAAAPMVPYT